MNDKENILLAQLTRLEAKLDVLNGGMNRVNERLSKLEAKNEVQEAVNKKVEELWAVKNQGVGIKTIFAWLIPVAMSLYSFLK